MRKTLPDWSDIGGAGGQILRALGGKKPGGTETIAAAAIPPPYIRLFGSYFLRGGRATAAACKRRSYNTQGPWVSGFILFYSIRIRIIYGDQYTCKKRMLCPSNKIISRHFSTLV